MISNILLAAAGVSGGGDTGPQIGSPYGGGFFAGVMNYGVPGEDYNLILAPVSTQASLAWRTSNVADTFANSYVDGFVNSQALNFAGLPAIFYCRQLTEGGFTDWYLPARNELELVYRNLKPGAGGNSTGSVGAEGSNWITGVNPNSIPAGVAYTSILPGLTTAAAFVSGQPEALVNAYYHTSNQAAVTKGWALRFAGTNFQMSATSKATAALTRAVRRELIIP